ncbi:MAG: hypothetical protein ACTSPN_01205 [Promethearchaeota archaeon]
MSIEMSNYNIDQKDSSIESINSVQHLPINVGQNIESFNMSQISTIDESGLLKSTFVVGNYAYLADSDFGLRILNIEDKSNPVVVGQYKNEGLALDVQVIGNYAYLANGKVGLEIIDISDPTHLEKIGEFNDGDGCSKIKVEGDRAFISSSSFSIKIIDISNPGIPNKIGEIHGTELDYTSISKFEVSGNFLYVLNFLEGLLIFNVTDVTNPTLISQYKEDYIFTYGIDIVGNLAYISGNTLSYTNDIFIILDISDPANPLEIRKEIGYIYAHDILINGDFAYCNFGDGFRIYNIANPNNITQLGSYSDNGEYIHLFASEDYIYLVDSCYGLKIIDVSDPLYPAKIAGFEDGEYFSDFIVEDNYIYLVDSCCGLKIIDISDPANPNIIGLCNLQIGYGAIAIKGNYLYIADGEEGLEVIDVSDPTNPSIAANYTGMEYIWNIEVAGNYAFLINLSKNMDILDITNPLNPTMVKRYASTSYLDLIKVYGDIAYLISTNGLIDILDISDPTNPIAICEYHSKEYQSLGDSYSVGHQFLLKDNFAYLTSLNYNGLEIINIANPSNPTYIAQFENGTSVRDVQIFENLVWIIVVEGIKILDTSVPTNTSIIEQYNIPYLFKLQIIENYVYTCSAYRLSIFYLADQNPNIYGMPIHWIIIFSGFGVVILILKSRKYKNNRK